MATSSNNVGEISTQPLNALPNDEVTKLKTSLQREKAAKRKMVCVFVLCSYLLHFILTFHMPFNTIVLLPC